MTAAAPRPPTAPGLYIDPAQLESYKAAVQEQIEAAIRLEPGVLVLYSVSNKDNPTHVTVFEIYRDPAAYQAHLQTAHFKKFRDTTNAMVTSRCAGAIKEFDGTRRGAPPSNTTRLKSRQHATCAYDQVPSGP